MMTREVRETIDLRLMIQVATMLIGMAAVWFAQAERISLLDAKLATKTEELAKMEKAVEALRNSNQMANDRLIRVELQLSEANRKLDRILNEQAAVMPRRG